MKCHQVRERLAEYLAGAFRGNDLNAFEGHLQSCQDCANELESVSKLDVRLRQEVPRYWESIEPAPGFLVRLQRVELERSPGWISVITGAFSALWLRHRPALAAGLSILLVVTLALIVPRMIAPAPVGVGLIEKDVDEEMEVAPVSEPPQIERLVEVAGLDAAPVKGAEVALADKVDRDQQIARAVDYLRSSFNPEVGLIFQSKEPGFRMVGSRQYRYDQIYWLYPDNLIASYVLQPFDAEMAQEIAQTLRRYAQRPSRLFEVLFGEPIPRDISIANEVVVAREAEFLIIARFHDSPMPLSWQDYGDMLIYQSLNQHLRGEGEAARKYFHQAYSMWDGKGIYDAATRREGIYATHKLALILYAGRVLNITINSQIEARLWSMQNPDGGIAAYVTFHGDRLGPSDSRTTAMALLPYNERLIDRMREMAKSGSISDPAQ
ncbi:MAG: hypothetical protein DDT26_02599 [Dehalococcoidia bacterium]|nr:hypothetical protein [Chloroflexota bacterium]